MSLMRRWMSLFGCCFSRLIPFLWLDLDVLNLASISCTVASISSIWVSNWLPWWGNDCHCSDFVSRIVIPFLWLDLDVLNLAPISCTVAPISSMRRWSRWFGFGFLKFVPSVSLPRNLCHQFCLNFLHCGADFFGVALISLCWGPDCFIIWTWCR